MQKNEDLSPSQIDSERCVAETWIDKVHAYDQTDSTNSRATEWAANQSSASGDPLAELFIARRQTGGRGRGNNSWWSAPGALTFSVLLQPLDLCEARLPLVSLTVGAALCEAIEPFASSPSVPSEPGVQLKWPNDVFIAGKKVGGVLIEIPPARPHRVVIGVGLNVNNSMSTAPAELLDRATSLADLAGATQREFDLTDVLIACLTKIGEGIDRLTAGDTTLALEWRSRSLLTGRWVRIEAPGREVEGICESIAPDGALLVRTPGGVEPCYGGVVAEFR